MLLILPIAYRSTNFLYSGFVDMMPLESCVDDDGNESSTLDETLYGFGELLDESVDTIDRRTPMPRE